MRRETLEERIHSYVSGDYYPFHMPGHKRRGEILGEAEKLDLTELPNTDDLHHPAEILLWEEERAARLFGAARSRFLVNGSSSGILAAMGALFRSGDTILCARNVHRSVIHGIYLFSLQVRWLLPEEAAAGMPGPISADEVRKALKETPEAAGVVLTSPSYEGFVSDIKGIAALTKEAGIPLLVDEAHGAHFLSFAQGFPANSVSLGADLCVQSLHKTLPSPTQTAILHEAPGFQRRDRLERFLSVFQTSSPSYILMTGISGCLSFLEKNGREAFSAYRKRLDAFYQRLDRLKNLELLSVKGRDDGKLVILTGEEAGQDGIALASRLRRDYHLEPEMAAPGYCLAMTSVMDTDEGFERLEKALITLDRSWGRRCGAAKEKPGLPEIRMCIHDAMEEETEELPFTEAAGRVVSREISMYPPETPLLLPGELLSEELIGYIQRLSSGGYTVHGLSPEGRISVVKREKL